MIRDKGSNGRRGVAVEEGKIAAIEESIPEDQASKVIPMNGKVVTPGL